MTKRTRHRTRWMFHFRGEVYAMGPTHPMTKAEFLEWLKTWGGFKRLPFRTEYWRTL